MFAAGFEDEALGARQLLSVCLQLLSQKVDAQAPVLLAGLIEAAGATDVARVIR